MSSDYRPCVLAVFTNSAGEVLVAERKDRPGSWQFPQGGIDPGESPEVALKREMGEELGCEEFEILARAPDGIRYDFPVGRKGPHAGYCGQEQVWFLMRFAAGCGPDLMRATHDEFVETAWVTPAEALRRIISFKRDAYRAGLTALGLL